MRLSGGRCTRCAAWAYPLRRACTGCGSPMEPALLSGAGRLEAWTTIRVAPAGFDAPYVLGYVRLDEGPRVLALVDAPVAALDFGRAMEVEPAGSAGRPPRPTGGLRARVAPEAARAAAAPHPEVARG